MNVWHEILLLAGVVAAGTAAARWLSRQRLLIRLAGNVLPPCILAPILMDRYTNWLFGLYPLQALAAGRIRYLLLALVISLGLGLAAYQAHRRWCRCAVRILMPLFLVAFCAAPIMAPAVVQPQLAAIETQMDTSGVCMQSTPYTCGPAAAVTALHQLGLRGDEAQLAMLAKTSPITGTLPWSLYSVLKDQYEDVGLRCEFKAFDGLPNLQSGQIVLVALKQAALLEHCVAVLEISDERVLLADPQWGLMSVPMKNFQHSWNHTGILLERTQTTVATVAEDIPAI